MPLVESEAHVPEVVPLAAALPEVVLPEVPVPAAAFPAFPAVAFPAVGLLAAAHEQLRLGEAARLF
ncbi:MAG: hypothetical protein JW738_00520 [Actinobacteria bacterium]|nr:hypothetical protein [Actinomycetota bacterium]